MRIFMGFLQEVTSNTLNLCYSCVQIWTRISTQHITSTQNTGLFSTLFKISNVYFSTYIASAPMATWISGL